MLSMKFYRIKCHIRASDKLRNIFTIFWIFCIPKRNVKWMLPTIICYMPWLKSKLFYFLSCLFLCCVNQNGGELITAISANNRIIIEIALYVLCKTFQCGISNYMTIHIIYKFKIINIHLYTHAMNMKIALHNLFELFVKPLTIQESGQRICYRHFF